MATTIVKPKVSASINAAIKDLIKADISPKSEIEASILYKHFKDADIDEEIDIYHLGDYDKSFIKKLDEDGYIWKSHDEKVAALYPEGKEYIDKLKTRIDTRRQVKSGSDLFPEHANIPEYKVTKATLTDRKPTKPIEVKKEEKQPWEMTFEEYYKLHKEEYGWKNKEVMKQSWLLANLRELYEKEIKEDILSRGIAKKMNDINACIGINRLKAKIQSQTDFDYCQKAIKELYKKAMSEGKPVPEEVLSEYPDLIGKIRFWMKIKT